VVSVSMLDEGFARPVLPGGYAWWYFDAISDDGERALTAIFFRGSVFSPDYARRARTGGAHADEHLGVNLALYERGRQRAWVMSEYGAEALRRADGDALTIAGSSVERTPAGGLRVRVEERSAPFLISLARAGAKVAGTVELMPLAPAIGPSVLESATSRRHEWQVPLPRARVRVSFERPQLRFEGTGYHDVNRGDGRLEDGFSRWSWARFHPPSHERRALVLYALRDRAGGERALIVDTEGGATPTEVRGETGPPHAVGWGLRAPRWFSGGALKCVPAAWLERAPFYARYTADLHDGGRAIASGLGEHLDLDRFRAPGVQFLLRFKTRKVS
jgi:carotenoid 1,2-hydratase